MVWPKPFQSNRSRLVQWLPRPTSSWRTKSSMGHAEEQPSVVRVVGEPSVARMGEQPCTAHMGEQPCGALMEEEQWQPGPITEAFGTALAGVIGTADGGRMA